MSAGIVRRRAVVEQILSEGQVALRAYLAKPGNTQEKVARHVGIDRTELSRLARGVRRTPILEIAIAIEDALYIDARSWLRPVCQLARACAATAMHPLVMPNDDQPPFLQKNPLPATREEHDGIHGAPPPVGPLPTTPAEHDQVAEEALDRPPSGPGKGPLWGPSGPPGWNRKPEPSGQGR
jgi:transcriptional regulator with XRE-family HTH domain